jgi:hypothetical protein
MATQSTSLRLPAILLAISPIPFIGVFAAGLLGFAGKLTTTFDKITPEVMATISLPWTIIFISTFIAFLLGNLGSGLLANHLKATNARALSWLVLLGVLANVVIGIGNLYLRLSMVSFTEATLGQTAQWQISYTLVYIFHLLNFAVLALLGLSLFIGHVLRRTGLVVGILSGLLFIAGLVPSIADRTPPFVFVFLWLALGIGLLRRRTA